MQRPGKPWYGKVVTALQQLAGALGVGQLVQIPRVYCSGVRANQSPIYQALVGRRRPLPRERPPDGPLSWEPFLRPTRSCDAHAPAVMTLAHRLRQETRSDWEYAQAIFRYVCDDIWLAIVPPPPRGVEDTLERGCGMCTDKLNVLAALARAGGIPARFCRVGARFEVTPAGRGAQVPPMRWFIDALGVQGPRPLGRRVTRRGREVRSRIHPVTPASADRFGWGLHPHIELNVGTVWIPGDPTWGDVEAAGLGIGLPRLGYDPVRLWGHVGQVLERQEEMPEGRQQRLARRLFCLSACGSFQCANQALAGIRARGRRILEELGRDEYIRRTKHLYVPVPGPAALGGPPPCSP